MDHVVHTLHYLTPGHLQMEIPRDCTILYQYTCSCWCTSFSMLSGIPNVMYSREWKTIREVKQSSAATRVAFKATLEALNNSKSQTHTTWSTMCALPSPNQNLNLEHYTVLDWTSGEGSWRRTKDRQTDSSKEATWDFTPSTNYSWHIKNVRHLTPCTNTTCSSSEIL